jgi:PAS domain S-box-containing protein
MTKKPTYKELEQRIEELERQLLEAKPTQEELQEDEGIRQLLKFAPYGIYLVDLSGKIVAVNNRGAEHLGKHVDEIIGTTLLDYFPQDVAEHKRVKGTDVVVSLRPVSFEDHVGNRWYSNSIFPVLGNQDKITHLAIYGADITDSKLKQEALRESEERYRTLFENMTQGAFRQRADGALVDVNAAALKMLGLTREEFLGRTSETPAWDVIREDGARSPGTEHPSAVALRTGKPVFGVVLGVRNELSKDRVWMEINAIPEFSPGASDPYQVMVTMHPVTERKRAEEALLFKENIISCSSSVIATCDLEGNMTYGNPSFLKTWGFDDPKEFLGRPFWEFWLVENILDEILQALRGDGTWFGEIKAMRKDGAIFDVRVSAAMVFDSGGNPVALTSTSIDITERKRAEEALRDSEQRLRLAVKTAGLAIWDWDLTENTVFWDNPWENLFDGPLKKESAYEWWAERIHPEDRDAVLSTFNSTLAGREESLVVEYRFRRTDGAWADVYDHCQIMRDESGQACRIIGAVMDVTGLHRAEGELRQARDELERRVEERTAELEKRTIELEREIAERERFEKALKGSTEELAEQLQQRKQLATKLVELLEKDRRDTGMVLHDAAGQILTVIKMDLDYIEEQFAMSPALARIRQVKDRIAELIKLVRQISLSLRPVALETLGLIPSVQSLIESLGEHGRIPIHLFTKDVSIRFDPQKELALYRIAQESLTNALKHAQAREIFVNLIRRKESILLTVEDDGTGFDAAEISKVGPLRKGSLGLAIMRERTLQCGGSFEIESNPGKGTQVIVEIPVGQER